MGDIRIRVGVGLDANVRSVYRPLVAAAQEAAQQIMRALNTGHKLSMGTLRTTAAQVPEVFAGPYRTAGKRAGDELVKVTVVAEREARRQANLVERAERQKEAAYRRMVREMERSQREETRIVDRELRARSAAAEREHERMARRTGYWAMRNFSPVTPTLSMGRRVAGDLARGAGVNFDTGSLVSNYVNRQTMATQLSNAAHIREGGVESAKTKVDPRVLMAEANKTALDTASDATEILSGMSAFVGKTGDLATARSIMADMARLSKATGSNMQDMLDASADVANALGDIPNKGRVIFDTMRAIAGQGQVGAVEIKDMASNMSKLAAMTGAFKIEGSTAKILEASGLTDATSQNVAIMGAMAQAAKAHGGRPTATTAANSSMSFIRDMSNRTTMKRWREQGLDVFTDKSQTAIRDPKALILEVLNKTKGDLGQIANLMPNQNSRAVLTAFKHHYQQGIESAEAFAKKDGKTLTKDEKHRAGLKMAADEFDNLLKVTMSNSEVAEKFGNVMQGDAAKAQIFQQKLQMIADTTSSRLLPAMEKLAPYVAQAADAFGKFLVWAVGNPGQAVATALSASIAKASLDNVVRTGIEQLFQVQNGKGKGIAGAAGNIGATFTIAALAITTAQIGIAYIDSMSDKENKRIGDNAAGIASNLATGAHIEGQGAYTPEQKKQLEADIARARAQYENQKANPVGSDMLSKIVGTIYFPTDFVKQAKEDQRLEQERLLKAQLDTLTRLERTMQKIEQKKIGEVYGPPRPPEAGMSPVPAVVK